MCCIPRDQREKQTDPRDPLHLSLPGQGCCHTWIVWIHWHLYIQLALGVHTPGGIQRVRRQRWYLMCAGLESARDPRTNILQKRGKRMRSVHIYTASAAREASWQLYLHVCSLGEHNQLGSCRSLAGFPTHALSTPSAQQRRGKEGKLDVAHSIELSPEQRDETLLPPPSLLLLPGASSVGP